jgi:DNA-binding NarL/FixJ family response regulator
VVEGCTNPEIGRILGISAGTVRTHVSKILEKLGVTDRTEATSVALRRGLV